MLTLSHLVALTYRVSQWGLTMKRRSISRLYRVPSPRSLHWNVDCQVLGACNLTKGPSVRVPVYQWRDYLTLILSTACASQRVLLPCNYSDCVISRWVIFYAHIVPLLAPNESSACVSKATPWPWAPKACKGCHLHEQAQSWISFEE